MPEIFNIVINSFASLSVWQNSETEEFFYNHLSLSLADKRGIQDLKLRKRRVERLGCRAALVSLLRTPSVEITYSAYGSPQLNDHYLSFSHSGDLSAAAVSQYQRIGIDIQKITPKIDALFPKFLNETEIHTFDVSNRQQLHLLWGAKEAAYKLYQQKNLDFAKHIHLLHFDAQQGKGKIITESESINIQFYHWVLNDSVLVLAGEDERSK